VEEGRAADGHDGEGTLAETGGAGLERLQRRGFRGGFGGGGRAAGHRESLLLQAHRHAPRDLEAAVIGDHEGVAHARDEDAEVFPGFGVDAGPDQGPGGDGPDFLHPVIIGR
jgi:hypothetical protein